MNRKASDIIPQGTSYQGRVRVFSRLSATVLLEAQSVWAAFRSASIRSFAGHRAGTPNGYRHELIILPSTHDRKMPRTPAKTLYIASGNHRGHVIK